MGEFKWRKENIGVYGVNKRKGSKGGGEYWMEQKWMKKIRGDGDGEERKQEERGEQTPSISVPVQLLRRGCSTRVRSHTRTHTQQTAHSADG